MSLYEKYRPQTWPEVIGNAKEVSRLRMIVQRHKGNQESFALWIDGASGTGKTTLAHIVGRELGADAVMDVHEYNGKDLSEEAAQEVRYGAMRRKAWRGGFRVFIVNEAHAMKPGAVQVLLSALEEMPARCCWIFTTTEGRKTDMFGTFDSPLKSRCIGLSLTNQGLAEVFAARVQEIAEAEGLGGATAKEYLALVRESKNNMRAALEAIDGFEMYREAVAV